MLVRYQAALMPVRGRDYSQRSRPTQRLAPMLAQEIAQLHQFALEFQQCRSAVRFPCAFLGAFLASDGDRVGCWSDRPRNWRIAAQGALSQQLLDTLDRVALVVEALTDTAKQRDVVGTIISATTRSFEWSYLGKARFPKAQDMLRNLKILSYFADCSKGFGGFCLPAHRPFRNHRERRLRGRRRIEQVGHFQTARSLLDCGLLSAKLI